MVIDSTDSVDPYEKTKISHFYAFIVAVWRLQLDKLDKKNKAVDALHFEESISKEN